MKKLKLKDKYRSYGLNADKGITTRFNFQMFCHIVVACGILTIAGKNLKKKFQTSEFCVLCSFLSHSHENIEIISFHIKQYSMRLI